MAGRAPLVSTRGTLSRLNWRITVVQFLANAIVIGLVILVLPGVELHAQHQFLAVLWLAAVFGLITALVRPALEFLFLPYVLQSLGLIMVGIYAILLALLALTSVLAIGGVVPLLVGAVIAGGAGFVLDSVLGLTPPVLEDASLRAARSERAVRIAGVSERLRVMQLYGIVLQYIVDLVFDWAWLRPARRRLQAWLWGVPVPVAKLPPQVKVRLLLEDLGPTYVKLGQILSSQGRTLPVGWEDELAKLQSEVRPVSYDAVRLVVEQSLGAPPELLYEAFNPIPLAAASLGQVHEATMRGGRRVAVKVQRPNIHVQLRSDIKILARGATVLGRRVSWAADADLAGVVREFGSTLLRELDYTVEAYNTRRLERVLAKIDGVHVPDVEPALSSDRVLTLEFIDGVKATDIADIESAGLDRQELARTFVRSAVQMVMIDGFFHADPHPGNVIVELASGRLTFLDAGMVGQLDLSKRIRFARFLLAFRDRDISDMARTLRSLSDPFREPDESAFKRDFERRIGPLIDQPEGHTAPLQRLVSEAVDVLRDNGYRLDPQLTLAAKAVAQAEAITSALVPETGASDFAQLGGAALEELVPEALNNDAILGAARKHAILTAEEVAERLPVMERAAARWVDQLAKGEIPVGVRLADLDRYSTRVETFARLIAAAVLLTGLLIGSAIAATMGPGKAVFRNDVSDVALVVYLAATAVTVAFVIVLLWRLVHPAGPRRTPRENLR